MKRRNAEFNGYLVHDPLDTSPECHLYPSPPKTGHPVSHHDRPSLAPHPASSWQSGRGKLPRVFFENDGYGHNTPSMPASLSPKAIAHSISEPPGGSAWERWAALANSLSSNGFHVGHIITKSFDLFFRYLYPLTPIVYEPSMRRALSIFLSQPLHDSTSPVDIDRANLLADWSGMIRTTSVIPQTNLNAVLEPPLPDTAFTLITAVAAEAAFLLPKDIFHEKDSIGDILLQASRSCLDDYLEADLESPNASSIAIRYFHSNCLHAAGRQKYSWHIFGEATRLALAMRLFDESSLDGLPPVEAELRRRAFWILFVGDKSAAILNNQPITIHRFSFDVGITTAYPASVEAEHRSDSDGTGGVASRCPIDGFNANVSLWHAAADLLLELRLILEKHHQPALTREQQSSLDTLYIRFITCLDSLPAHLQPYCAPPVVQPSQFAIQSTNLHVSLHCLRLVIAQKFDDLSLDDACPRQADLRKTEIARDMLRVMHDAPFWSLQINGEPHVSSSSIAVPLAVAMARLLLTLPYMQVEKMRLIGASLLSVIHRNEGSPLAARAKADFSVLLDTLTRLDSKASDALRRTQPGLV